MASAKALDALTLVGVRLVASGVVWLTGFRAISDDDYARVVISQQFASAPQLDPSGTSWLPLPFWLQGIPMLVFGASLETARAVAWVLGIASTLLVWQAAIWLGMNRKQAFIGAAIASVFPYSARLGVATVPEQITASLLVLGAASLATPSVSHRALGALALCGATLARYEAWPIAAAFGCFCLRDALAVNDNNAARRSLGLKRAALAGALCLAVSGMLLWLLHGLIRHGDATFFVKRVQDYQHALGGNGLEFGAALTRHPLLILRHEPELIWLTASAVLLSSWFGRTGQLTRFKRPAWLMACLLGFLMVGDLRGAGATHHAERALLPLWTTLALVSGALWPAVIRSLSDALDSRGTWGVGLLVVGTTCAIAYNRQTISSRDPFVDRSSEVGLGRKARQIAADGQLLVIGRDYGYFAMMAGFADPARSAPYDDQDPRSARSSDPFGNLLAFQDQLRARRVRALIAPQSRAAQARRLGRVVAGDAGYLLVAIAPTVTR